jgi:hypothetical protein
MSRQNKANKNNSMQAGRLTPDDLARERQKQRKPDEVKGVARTSTVRGKREEESTRGRSAPEE